MTPREEQEAATEAVRQMTREEMLKVDPNKYDGITEKVYYTFYEDGKDHVPLAIIETEDEDLIRDYIAEWYNSEITEDGMSY